jgi:putative flippase GtrA
MALDAPGFYARIRPMLPEFIKFCIIGGIGTVIDLGGAAVLHGRYHVEPLAAKAVSVTVATLFTYLGSRFWTFRHRENRAMHHEALLFFVLNLVGLLIAEAVIGLATYGMGLHGSLGYNAASVVGTGLGTIFRFYAYRKWVFLAPSPPSTAAGPDAAVVPDYPPWELDPSILAAQPAGVPVVTPAYTSPWGREASVWGRETAPAAPEPALARGRATAPRAPGRHRKG